MNELDDVLAYLAADLLGWRSDAYDYPDPNYGWWYKQHRHCISELLTGNGMLEIIEAMRERGFRFWISYRDHTVMEPYFGHRSRRVSTPSNSMPEAVARAAYAALREGT